MYIKRNERMLLSSILIVTVLTSIMRDKNEYKKWVNRISLIILIYVLLINVNINNISDLILGYNIYNNMLIINNLNNSMINIILIIGIIYMLLLSYNISIIKEIDRLIIIRKWLSLLIIFNILGLILLMLVNDLILLFVIIELQSYSLYLITAINNESNNSIKSGLYYFIVGSLGSFIILDGTIGIYEDIGLTNLEYIILYIDNINIYNILIILFGLFIKIGLAPFYNYSITIYTLSPTMITNYISLMPKLSILTLILNLINIINLIHNNINLNIINLISLIIFISMIIGSIGGMNVIRIKTLLAYSSLLNVSYMLLAIISNNNYSIIAYLFYILQYSITHINIFSIILLIPLYSNLYLYNSNNNNNIYNVMISKYSPIEYISQLKLLLNKNICLCICFIISIFSLIGIPPLSGFYGKLLVLISSLNNGYIFLSITLVIVSSISAYYYGNIIKELSFDILNNYNIFNYKEYNISNIKILNKLNKNELNKNNLLYNMNNKDGDNSIIYLNNNITYIISVLTLIIILISLEYDNIIGGTYLVLLGINI